MHPPYGRLLCRIEVLGGTILAALITCLFPFSVSTAQAKELGLMSDIMNLKELAILHLPFHDEQTLQSVSLVPVGARKTKDMAGTGIYFSQADEMGSIEEVR